MNPPRSSATRAASPAHSGEPNRWPSTQQRELERFPIAIASPVPRLVQLSKIQSGLQPAGGLVCEDSVVGALFCDARDAKWLLDRWIAGRRVLAFTWLGRRLLPLFQFDFAMASVRTVTSQVLAEFDRVFDNWESVEWFASPNLWLADHTPAEMIVRDPHAVVGAARADRYIAVGSS